MFITETHCLLRLWIKHTTGVVVFIFKFSKDESWKYSSTKNKYLSMEHLIDISLYVFLGMDY